MGMKMSSVTLIRNEDQIIPGDVVAKILSRDPSSLGICFAKPDFTLGIPRFKHATFDEKALNKTFSEHFLKTKFIYNFGLKDNKEELQHEEDLQPFVLVKDENGKALIAAFLDGNFDHHLPDKPDTHTAEFHAVKNELQPRVDKLLKLCDGDPERLMKELEDPIFGKDLVNLMQGDLGTITIAGADGTVIHHKTQGDETAKETEWGWLSSDTVLQDEPEPVVEEPYEENLDDLEKELQAQPMAEPQPVQQQVTPPKKAGWGGKPAKANQESTRVAPVGDPAGSPQPDVAPAAKPASPADGTASPQLKDGKIIIEKKYVKNETKNLKLEGAPGYGPVPDGYERVEFSDRLMSDGRQKKKALRKVLPNISGKLDELIPDWFWIKSVLVRKVDAKGQGAAPKPIKDFKDIPQTTEKPVTTSVPAAGKQGGWGKKPAAAVAAAPKTEVEAARAAGSYPAKDTAPHHVGKQEQKQPAVSVDFIPLVPPEDKKAILALLQNDNIKKVIDRHSQQIIDPKLFHKMESKIPSFAEELGLNMEDVAKWPYEMFEALHGKSKAAICKAAFSLAISLSAEKKNNEYLLSEIDKLGEQRMDTTGTSGVSAKETAPAPKKASGWGKKAAVA